MSTERNLTPEGFRTAAYLEARARMDFRRGKRGPVHCTPGNKKCGNRCIPNEWDCRMKGEGNDPHLKARRFDPVSGVANLERGTKRVGKFLRTGSFSELESGKRSLIRGAVKLRPGNLKDKKDYQTWLENNFAKVAIPLALLGGGLAVHSILKTHNYAGYREGAGRRVEETVSNGIGRVLDVIPGIGNQRAYTRQRAGQVLSSLSGRTYAAKGFQKNLGGRGGEIGLEGMQIPELGDAGVNKLRISTAAKAIAENLEAVDIKQVDFYTWNEKHREAFLGATVNGKSVFAETTAQVELARKYNLDIPRGASKEIYIDRLTQIAVSERIALVQLAKQMGYKTKKMGDYEYVDQDDRVRFLERAYPGIDYSDITQASIAKNILITVGPGRSSTRAQAIYITEVNSWDNYFKEVAKYATESPGASSTNAKIRGRGIDQIRAIADTQRARYLMGTTNSQPRAGLSHEQLFLRDYYHRNVVGTAKSTYSITPNLARSAASELSGTEIATPQEAIELLRNEYGFPTVQLITSRTSKPSATTPPSTGAPRPMRRRSPAQQIADLMRQKNPDGTPRYATREAAEAEWKRRRGDADEAGLSPRVRAYLETTLRLDKRCGKSGIPDNRKCSKPTTAQSEAARNRARGAAQPGLTCNPPNKQCGNLCIPPTATCHLRGGGGGGALDNAAKIAAIAGSAAAVVGAVRNRKQLARSARQGTLQARRSLRKNNRELYRNTAVRARVARRTTGNVVRTQTDQIISNLSKKTIKALSSQQVNDGISRLPKHHQDSVRRLVGGAKVSAAHLALTAKGGTMTSVNNTDNFSNWKMKDGTMLSTGSVGDSLLVYNTRPQESIGGARTYSTQFRIDGEFDAKSSSASKNARGIVATTKKMFQHHMDSLPDNSIVWAIPYSEDAKGAKRRSIYEKYGFRQALSSDERLFAMKTKGKFTKMQDNHIEQIADYIRNDSVHFDFDDLRMDKRCGKSGIPDNRKCSKTTAPAAPPTVSNRPRAGVTTKPDDHTARNVAIGAGVVGAAAVLGAIGVHQNKMARYRRNVPKSAIEAEKLAIEYERTMREQAASRLKKKVQDVTGFEASVYNYNDKGYERGFGPFENDAKWYGQTKKSKGGVVVLSYSEEYGKGGYNMVEGGAFQNIWGERDPLPFHNAVSQPLRGGGADNLQQAERREFLKNVEAKAGKQARTAVEGVIGAKEAFKRFKFLRDNVNERGFNPDSIRLAAFVVAQRRLTGKPIDILAYSNGGNVASETLAILAEMGYKDVKVLNVAGPTFGMFQHKSENMKTFVSKGDEFYKIFGDKAFTGGNTTYLKNDNIPHGLMDALDPNNPAAGDVGANRRARRSYTLDTELRTEGYKFLTLDKVRSRQLEEEILYKISKNEKFEGDLRTLYGDASDETFDRYAKLLANKGRREETKQLIRTEVEDRMLEVWYGGYNPSKVKNTQKSIRKELETYVSPTKKSVQTRRPMSLSERAAKLMADNPSMSRAAALKQAKREILETKTDGLDSYNYAYVYTLKRLVAA